MCVYTHTAKLTEQMREIVKMKDVKVYSIISKEQKNHYNMKEYEANISEQVMTDNFS